MERVDGRVDIAVMHRSTVGTRPLPYWQAGVASGTREAPTCRAGLGGETGRDFEELPTACSALVGEHAAKLRVSRTGHALPKGFCERSMGIFGPHNGLVFGDQPAREFMVAVCALIREPLLQPSRQVLPAPTLCLREPLCGLSQFVGVGNLLPTRQSEQVMKPRINPYTVPRRYGEWPGVPRR